MTSTSRAPRSKGYVITIVSLFGHEFCWAWNLLKGILKGIWNGNLEWEPQMETLNGNLEWEPGEKPPNPMRETGEENWETTENILAP